MIDTFLSLTEHRVPWAFARFNDGEMKLIINCAPNASRGHQQAAPSLRRALLSAMRHQQDRYYVGLPTTRYRFVRRKARAIVDRSYPYVCGSEAITHHWRDWISRFPAAIHTRPVIWIVGETAGKGLAKAAGRPPVPAADDIITVPDNDAWQYWVKLGCGAKTFPEDGIVLFSCGPLARVLVQHFFAERPDLTCIDIGTVYEPWTRNRRYKYHRRF